jgi:hypothetical protein
MLPDAWRRKQGLPPKLRASSALGEDVEPGAYDSIGDFKPKLHPKDLPKHVDWRGTGADPGVKDQVSGGPMCERWKGRS